MLVFVRFRWALLSCSNTLTILCRPPLLALHSPAEGKEGYADPKVKNILLLSPSWTSVSAVLAAAPTLTPPDGEPAGSAEILPTEMAGITPLEWSPTLVFCTAPHSPFFCCCWICHYSPYRLPPSQSLALWLIWAPSLRLLKKCTTTKTPQSVSNLQ